MFSGENGGFHQMFSDKSGSFHQMFSGENGGFHQMFLPFHQPVEQALHHLWR